MRAMQSKRVLPAACGWDEPLACRTHCRIGGVADVFCEATSEADVLAATAWRRAAGLADDDVFILGGGANVLINDARHYGLVLSLSERFNAITVDAGAETARIEAGIYTPRLVREAAARGWEGFQFLAGIPGTLGGAVAMNAGIRELATWDLVRRIEGITWAGERVTLTREALRPAYREGHVPPDVIVTAVHCEMRMGNAETIRQAARGLSSGRRATQPLQYPSWGSTFRNPSGASSTGQTAGSLIERAGCKGYRVGDAQISELHANFIVNRGAATAAEALACIRHAALTVRDAFGIQLVPEVRLIGFPADDLAFLAAA